MVRLILCSDQPLLEVGFRSMLEADPGFELLACCRNLPDAVRAVAFKQPHVFVNCLSLNPDSVVEVRSIAPRTEIVQWAVSFSPEVARRALDLGVRGFLNSTAEPEAVKDCLLASAAGETWMDRRLSISMLQSRPPRLSRRQTEVVRLLATGLKNKEIADKLGITEGTVKSYLTVLFEKVGVKDRFELALSWIKDGESLDVPLPRASRSERGAVWTRRVQGVR
jgi:two-component system, NarL family, nitrate/nitrite response regulator NarL